MFAALLLLVSSCREPKNGNSTSSASDAPQRLTIGDQWSDNDPVFFRLGLSNNSNVSQWSPQGTSIVGNTLTLTSNRDGNEALVANQVHITWDSAFAVSDVPIRFDVDYINHGETSEFQGVASIGDTVISSDGSGLVVKGFADSRRGRDAVSNLLTSLVRINRDVAESYLARETHELSEDVAIGEFTLNRTLSFQASKVGIKLDEFRDEISMGIPIVGSVYPSEIFRFDDETSVVIIPHGLAPTDPSIKWVYDRLVGVSYAVFETARFAVDGQTSTLEFVDDTGETKTLVVNGDYEY